MNTVTDTTRTSSTMRRGLPGALLAAAFFVTFFAAGSLGAGEPCRASAENCVRSMTEHFRSTGWVGITIEPRDNGGLVVKKVWPKSPAAAAGLLEGDVLVAFEGVAFERPNQAKLKKAYEAKKVPGNRVTYTVRRGERQLDVSIELASVPEEIIVHQVGEHMLHAHAEPANDGGGEP